MIPDMISVRSLKSGSKAQGMYNIYIDTDIDTQEGSEKKRNQTVIDQFCPLFQNCPRMPV